MGSKFLMGAAQYADAMAEIRMGDGRGSYNFCRFHSSEQLPAVIQPMGAQRLSTTDRAASKIPYRVESHRDG